MSENRRHFRLAEVFGPTIQGEGRNVGVPCHFIRFGGCDFRCSWCDTPHAVLPEEVAKLERVTEWDILHKIDVLSKEMSPTWVVITGGNPGLLNLNHLIDLLHVRSHSVMVETQGSTFREWYGKVDDLCFSPKPPSSGMPWSFTDFDRILDATIKAQTDWARVHDDTFLLPYLKVPVFTDEDLDFASEVHHKWPDLDFFISIGNDDPYLPTISNPHPEPRQEFDFPKTRDIILVHQKHWTEKVLKDQRFDDCRIFSQQHVLLWGNERGH